MQEIKVELTKNPKQKPTDESKLSFGTTFTDHMFVMNYDKGEVGTMQELFRTDHFLWSRLRCASTMVSLFLKG